MMAQSAAAQDPTPAALLNYVYSPLLQNTYERWIRVLDLFPSADRDAPLRARLRTVKLQRGLHYEAVSYVWGDPPDTGAILIELNDNSPRYGVQRLRQNLADGLRVLRHADKVRTLWADALCINQLDTEERSQQVGLMGLIFWLAESTLVWLGPDPNGVAQDVFDEMKVIANWWWHGQEDRPGPRWGRDEVASLDAHLWHGIAALYRNPWFGRVWIQQEIGLGGYAWFHWGATAQRCDHHDVFGFDLCFEQHGKLVAEQFAIDNYYVLTARNQWLNYGRSTRAAWPGDDLYEMQRDRPFLQTLASCADCKATDPRDRVYAFLGHPSARRRDAYRPEQSIDYLELMDQEEPTIVRADYSKSVDEVYLETAEALLRQHGDLRFLGAVRHTDESLARDDYPSWVPRWDQIGDHVPLGTFPPHSRHAVSGDGAPSPFVSNVEESETTEYGSTPKATLTVFGLAYKTIDRLFDFNDGTDWLQQQLRGRRFFRSNSEQDGLAPTAARPGDVVAIVVGSFVPCLLRHVGDEKYKFVGTCFVYGIMNGEMARIVQQEKASMRQFVLA